MGARLLTLGSIVVGFLAVWAYLLQSELPEEYQSAVQLLPLWALVAFGCYSLCVIGWSLAHFPTCPDDAETLQREMDEAQKELLAKGILTKEEIEGEDK